MKALKITIPLSLATWWIPILGPIINGIANAFLERRIRPSVLSAVVSSSVASALYVFLALKFLFVPLFGNLFQFLAVLLSVIGIGISTSVAYVVSRHMTYSYYSGDSLNVEFYAKSQEEIERRLGPFLEGCGEPTYSFSEKKIIVKRNCSQYAMEYEITQEGRKYRVSVHIRRI
ncbi:MAG: hypothetical protein K1T65_04070 [Candidatus Aramenus sp.]|nr:hypothetical protein [Candidatus Aramenus sp.]